MYYETMMHERREVSGAAEAAELIHKGEVHDFDALCWSANGRQMVVVADNHCNNAWGEVAVIDMARRVQIESITFAWIKDLEGKIQHLQTCETCDFQMGAIKGLPIDGKGDDTPAYFECGCCGESFKSTYATQKKYDQDNGYGICRRCSNAY
jgi:hypothetical protein